MENKQTDILVIQQEINKQVANPQVMDSLMEITFKGLQPAVAKRAMLEAMMRRFTFQDFLDKNVYAIPFGQGYSLVNSIDYNRKIGMRSGVCGVSAPIYTDDKDGNCITCEITVKRSVSGFVGEYTALVYFKEYSTGYNQWKAKPRTMIAKVAEMHALRKACPEELSQSYIEEEVEREVTRVDEIEEKKELKKEDYSTKLKEAKTLLELRDAWSSIPGEFKTSQLTETKDLLRDKFEEEINKAKQPV